MTITRLSTRLGLALCPHRCCFSIGRVHLCNIPSYISNPSANGITKSATGMQDDISNCAKKKQPPRPGATPESFANALKLWEKEVKKKKQSDVQLA